MHFMQAVYITIIMFLLARISLILITALIDLIPTIQILRSIYKVL